MADFERFRDLLGSKGLYQKEDVDVFTRETKVSLELERSESIWQNSLFTLVLGSIITLLFQSFSGMGVAVDTTVLVFALFALFLMLTIAPLIYDVATGKRQLLNRLLIFLVIVSGDFSEVNSNSRSNRE